MTIRRLPRVLLTYKGLFFNIDIGDFANFFPISIQVPIMKMTVENQSVDEVFDSNSLVSYEVPPYQREYSWGKKECEELFDDFIENDKGYFLGTYICLNKNLGASNKPVIFELIDGQQRITTLSLLLLAIYKILGEIQDLKDDAIAFNESQNSYYVVLEEMIVKRQEDGSPLIRLSLQSQGDNNEDYRAVLAEAGIIEEANQPKYFRNRRIYLAYKLFLTRLENLVYEDDGKATKEGLLAVFNFLEKVRKATIVLIEVQDYNEACVLFESLNNRGLPLTAMDIIKNKLLFSLPKEGEDKKKVVQSAYEEWKSIIDNLGSEYSNYDRFLSQYYNAFVGELGEVGKAPIATKSKLIDIYEKLIAKDPRKLLDDLKNASKIYSMLLGNDPMKGLENLQPALLDLVHIEGVSSYILLLYLVTKRDELELKVDELEEIVKFLMRFFVRRNLTDVPPTRDIIRLFMGLVKAIDGSDGQLALKGEDIVDHVKSTLRGVSAGDEVFRQALGGPIYETNYGVARFILCHLCELKNNKEHKWDMWSVTSDKSGSSKKSVVYNWTIEHVLPQNKNLCKEWREMLMSKEDETGSGSGEKNTPEEIQEQYVHMLGNLTMSGYNSNLKDANFEKKRDKTKNGQPIGYKNGLPINEDLKDAKIWNATAIKNRTDRLVEKAMEAFDIGLKLDEASN